MKIIQITDTHLVPPGGTVNGVSPETQLRAVVDDIGRRHADADLVVVTGDLCNDGEPAAYALLRDILAPLACPVRLLLGNHDHRPHFVDAFPDQPRDPNGHIQSVMDTDHGRLLFLDSHEHGHIGGIYGADRLAWLDAALQVEGPVTVFIHHPPVMDGLAHFEHIRLHDDGAVLARLTAHAGGVRHIVFGHIHVPLAGSTPEGIAFSSGQSTAHRFVTDLADPEPYWTAGPPCYRILMIDDHGFRAYGAEVGLPHTARAAVCAGP
ncbi:phosphodiesterase [Falsirhodobacter halotolerans]|uniref:phosphodiesterase n=1 Tax=Falsirhodobacter halotolerans TaxID=1146892 RepID=UPI001FCFC0A5|nr:phosphodiesterase [Falsirhodobacter halotolerans]MCJ8141109.1 phosphodiesterase [Falsirhodobacter halotolerans]